MTTELAAGVEGIARPAETDDAVAGNNARRRIEGYDPGAGVASAVIFFARACVVSLLWRRRWKHGPLEWLMWRGAG